MEKYLRSAVCVSAVIIVACMFPAQGQLNAAGKEAASPEEVHPAPAPSANAPDEQFLSIKVPAFSDTDGGLILATVGDEKITLEDLRGSLAASHEARSEEHTSELQSLDARSRMPSSA